MVPTFFLVTIGVFLTSVVIPGDPARLILGEQSTREALAKFRKDLGLDQPPYIQYVRWLGQVVRGDLGRSYQTGRPVGEVILGRLPATLYIGLLSVLFGLAIGLPAGIISAVRANSWLDTVVTAVSVVFVGAPVFWLGLVMILIFGLRLHLLPTTGYTPLWEDPIQSLRLAILPAMASAVGVAAVIARQTRSSMLEVIRHDYIRTARAKGLRELVVVNRHALKNAMIPVITVIGIIAVRVVGGSVLVETIFAIPGMGRLLVDAIMVKDYAIVQGVVLIFCAVVLLGNLLVDIAYGYVDPRIRHG